MWAGRAASVPPFLLPPSPRPSASGLGKPWAGFPGGARAGVGEGAVEGVWGLNGVGVCWDPKGATSDWKKHFSTDLGMLTMAACPAKPCDSARAASPHPPSASFPDSSLGLRCEAKALGRPPDGGPLTWQHLAPVAGVEHPEKRSVSPAV